MNLHPLDWTLIVAYVFLTVGAGLWMSKKASGGMEAYFLGGRSLPWYLLGLAGMTMWFDVTGTMIITSFLFMLGPQGLFVEFRGGAVLILAFLLVFAGKWHRRSGCITGAEWQIFRFGKGKDAEWARQIAALVGIVTTVGIMAYLVKGTQLFMGMFLPFSPTLAALCLIGLTTLYTMFSGFYGVVVTDLIQGVIIIISSVVIAIMAWGMIAGPEALGELATSVTGNPGWLDSSPSWQVEMPDQYAAYESLVIVMIFYLLRNVLAGLGGGAEPRFFGARNDRECGLQCLLQGFVVMLRWPMMIGIAVMGLFLVQRELPESHMTEQAAALIKEVYPTIKEGQWMEAVAGFANNPEGVDPALAGRLNQYLGEQWPEKIRLVGYHGTVNPELVLPAVMKTELPVGVRGLMLVAMLAALMSTFDAMVNMGAAFFVRDVYQRWLRPKAKEKECVRVSYLAVLALVCLATWMGLAAESINDIWGWIVMGLGSGAAAPGVLRMVWWRLNGWGVAGSLFAGTAAAIVQRALWPDLSEWWQFSLITAISFGSCIGVSLLTRPTDAATLETFYRKTRPFGWWKPVRKKLEPDEQSSILKENKTDMLAVPFVLLAQVTLFLMAMQLVIHSYEAFWGTFPLFVVGATGAYWFWWRPLRLLDQQAQ